MAVVYKPNVVAEGRGNSTPLALSSACGSPLRDQRKQTILSESLSLLKGLSQRNRSYIFKSNYIHCFSSVHKGRSFFFFPKSIPGSVKGMYASILITGVKMLNL